MVLLLVIAMPLMILVMALHENDMMTVSVLVMVAVKDNNMNMAIPILIVIPMMDDRYAAVATAVVISFTEMLRYALIFRDNYGIVGPASGRERG